MSARSIAAGVVLVLVLALAARAHAVPLVFQVRASQCAGTEPRKGTAFVVQGFAQGHTPSILVTALHVVHSCNNIEIWDVECHDVAPPADERWALPKGATIQVWPAFDLAVVLLPGNPLRLQRELVDEQLDLTPASLQRLRDHDNRQSEIVDYRLPATSMSNYCMRGSVTHIAVRPTRAQFRELAAYETRRTSKQVTADALQGSLSPQSWLLNYAGNMDRGASGAPVTRDGKKVIAIHDAGFINRQSGWGIVLGGSRLAETPPVVVAMNSGASGATAWPAVQGSYLDQYAPDDFVEGELAAKARRRRLPSQNVLSLFFDTRLPMRDVGWGTLGIGGSFEYARHGTLGYVWGGYIKLGLALDATYSRLDVHRRFLSPGGEHLEQQDKSLSQIYFAPGLDLRVERIGTWWSPSLTLAVLGGRWFFANEVFSVSNPERWNWGVVASLKNRVMIRCASADENCFHLVLEIEASRQYTPIFDYRYTGVGADVEAEEDRRYLGYLGFNLGIEWFGVGQ
jgi:hypothetical protein